MSEPAFIPGVELSRLLFEEAVWPILAAEFPDLRYAAALIGYGSEIQGFDTARSRDHEWGPRLLLFVAEEDTALAPIIHETLRHRLPPTLHGYSTHFAPPDHEGTRITAPQETGPIEHKIEIHQGDAWLRSWLGVDPLGELTVADWLTMTQQHLLEVTAGRVHHDGLGTLTEVRSRLRYYPHDVWLYLMACQWKRIEQQETFVGRTGEVGDDLGSRLITAALVRDVMRLCFLEERRYAPYSKWFGTAFSRLAIAPSLTPLLHQALAAETWQTREVPLCAAYEIVAAKHNALGVTPPLDGRVTPFYTRPYRVIHGNLFVAALDLAITDPAVRRVIAHAGWIGAVDQFADSVDFLERADLVRWPQAMA